MNNNKRKYTTSTSTNEIHSGDGAKFFGVVAASQAKANTKRMQFMKNGKLTVSEVQLGLKKNESEEIDYEDFDGLSFNIFKEIQFDYLEMYYENTIVNIYNSKLQQEKLLTQRKRGQLRDGQVETLSYYLES